ncbi:MAG TPA: hypothetical protein VL096_22370 [Pirellulaceae bacterium]|nr:hypothetical protein [Pirellulaceae bacterium]
MSPPRALAPEIQLEDRSPESVRYILPRRRLGAGWFIGVILLIVGLVVMLAVALFVFSIVTVGPRLHPCGMLLAIFIGPMTWGGLTPFWWGLASFWGHRELELRGAYLRTIERVGPCWRSKRWSIETIQSLGIKPLSSDGKQPKIDPIREFNALVLFQDGGKQGMLAWGYPIALLESLAIDLAARCDELLRQLPASAEAQEPRSPISISMPGGISALTGTQQYEDDDDDFEEDDEDDEDEAATVVKVSELPPEGSAIEIERFAADEFTIRIPPTGIWKGSKGLFAFSLVWCGFMVVFDGIALYSMLTKPADRNEVWGLIGMSSLFWLVGIGIMLTAIEIGRRKAALAFADGHLMAIQSGIFRTKRREWSLDEIKSVRVGRSGTEVNDQPVLELQIVGQDDVKFGMLAGHRDDDLQWLAGTLQNSLTIRADEIPPSLDA